MQQIHPGQSVRVYSETLGEQFVLDGHVTQVSSQAVKQSAGSRAIPTFDLSVRVDQLTPEQSELLRIGMSARLDVLTYSNPDAIVIPHRFIHGEDDQHWVWRRNKADGEPQRVPVTVGQSLFDGVEITEGFEAGDELFVDLPERSS